MNLEMAQLFFSKELSCFKVTENMHEPVYVCYVCGRTLHVMMKIRRNMGTEDSSPGLPS